VYIHVLGTGERKRFTSNANGSSGRYWVCADLVSEIKDVVIWFVLCTPQKISQTLIIHEEAEVQYPTESQVKLMRKGMHCGVST
jgi:hypothetical protein